MTFHNIPDSSGPFQGIPGCSTEFHYIPWWVHVGSWVPVSLCGCVWSYVSLYTLVWLCVGAYTGLYVCQYCVSWSQGCFGVHSWTGNCMIILKILQNIHYAVCLLDNACLTTAFWGTARLGEVTVPKLDGFDPSVHIKLSNVQHNVRDQNDLEETVIFILWTKVAREKGENIFWAKQEGVVDPKNALENHIRVNNPLSEGHLFAFKHKDSM